MHQSAATFAFHRSVPMAEVQATLRLAQLAVESLHGEDRVRLDARATVNPGMRTCVIDLTSDVGRTLALVFGGYVRREFGDEAVELSTDDANATVARSDT